MTGTPSHTNLHITIGASIDQDLNLTQELSLMKTALLYGDRVKLCSLATSFLVTLLPMRDLTEDQQMEMMLGVADGLGRDIEELSGFMEKYRELRKKGRRSLKELQMVGRMKSILRRTQSELNARVDEIASKAGVDGLMSALNTGLVEVEIFDVNSESLTYDFFASIKESLISGKTYPLFDDATGDLVEATIREGGLSISSSSIERGKQAGLTSGLFSRLPLFEGATIDEIIDIRKELEGPLVRFRAAVVRFSKELESAQWGESFPEEVENIVLEYVEPAVLEIEEEVRSNKLLRKLVHKYVDKPLVLPGTSAIGLLLSSVSELPKVVAQALSLAAGSAALALDAAREWREETELIERNQLFFYYRLGELLGT